MPSTPAQPGIVSFDERQRVIANPLSWVVLPLSAYMWYEMGVLVVTGSPSPPSPGNAPIAPWGLAALFLVIGVAIPLWLWSMHLRTRLVDHDLDVRFRPFVRKRIPVDRISEASAIDYRPIPDCLGWGIRRYRSGLALTVRGRRGVLVTYELDGKDRTLLIGSQQAEALADAVSAAMRAEPARSSRESTRA